MIPQTPYKHTSLSPSLQFPIFIAVALGLIFLGNLIGSAIIVAMYGLDAFKQIAQFNMAAPHAVRALWILQIVSTTLPIFFTPIVFARLIVREPDAYLKTNSRFPIVLMPLVFAVMLVSTPIMEVLINLNQQMKLPEFLKGVENWMRSMENAAQKATEAMLHMNTIADMIVALLIVGLLTAIAEELMFRGCLQTIFMRWTKNPHAAIWITATLFSAFHLEFFGFIPRLMLGVLFGYFAAWSGSIWPAVWAHFLNNGSAVVMTYMYQHKQININPNDQHTFNYTLYVLSIIITVFLMLNYRTVALQKPQANNY